MLKLPNLYCASYSTDYKMRKTKTKKTEKTINCAQRIPVLNSVFQIGKMKQSQKDMESLPEGSDFTETLSLFDVLMLFFLLYALLISRKERLALNDKLLRCNF